VPLDHDPLDGGGVGNGGGGDGGGERGIRLLSVALCVPATHVSASVSRVSCQRSWTWHRVVRDEECGMPLVGDVLNDVVLCTDTALCFLVLSLGRRRPASLSSSPPPVLFPAPSSRVRVGPVILGARRFCQDGRRKLHVGHGSGR
jgi:hypothetical protein